MREWALAHQPPSAEPPSEAPPPSLPEPASIGGGGSHLPLVHVAWQTTPQAPQFFGSVPSVDSQPFAAMASQSAVPGEHVKPHAPALHTGAAFGGFGHTAHDGPHAVTSVSRAQVFPGHA